MLRATFLAMGPWLAVMLAAGGLLAGLVRFCGARPQWRRLGRLHADQVGGVQSLSFVLATPFFIMLMLLIVQVSQIMIGILFVQAAALAAARSASVWVGAWTSDIERQNQLVGLQPTRWKDGRPVRDWTAGGEKYQKVLEAAVLAVAPAGPSSGYGAAPPSDAAGPSLSRAYQAYAEASRLSPRALSRLANKLAFARAHTRMEIYLTGPGDQMEYIYIPQPDDPYYLPIVDTPDLVGWRDQITVTVYHDFALLPGPARMLARRTGSSDRVADQVQQEAGFSVYTLSATSTLGSEGLSSTRPYYPPLW